MDHHRLASVLPSIAEILESQGFDVRPIVIEDPATPHEIADLETALGDELPAAYRSVLLTISRHVEFRWFAPEARTFPPPFHGIFGGDLHWSVDLTAQFARSVQEWIEVVFPNPNDPYDAVWHNKLPVYEVGNGDYLALDLSDGSYGKVVYLSHDDGEGHGHVLAADFDDLLERWVPLGCPGGEDWQWLPFTADRTTMIEPRGTSSDAWRRLLGLDQ